MMATIGNTVNRPRFRIAALLFALRLTAFLSAQEAGGPQVLVQTVPDVPVTGEPWALTLLINHPEPDEVTVMAPPFTGSLFLDQVLKGPRMVHPASGQALAEQPAGTDAAEAKQPEAAFERWTAMEYRFMPQSPGPVTLDAFTVITPHGRTQTAPLSLDAQQAKNSAESRQYRLAWEGGSAGLTAGAAATLGLRIGKPASGLPLPGPEFFMPAVPPGVILESMRLSPADQAAGLVLKLRLIPLNAAPVALSARTLTRGNDRFEIPALRIPVAPAAKRGPAAAGDTPGLPDEQPGTDGAATPSAMPFPEWGTAISRHTALFTQFQSDCENVYRAAKNLWERGSRANALAELRRSERDHAAGPLFAELRREAERGLGLLNTGDEKRRGFLPALFGAKNRSGVLQETAVRRIPDPAGEAIARFREGQPVLVPPDKQNGTKGDTVERHGAWIRVIAHDGSGASGWIPAEKIIFY
jgi:hypothetical protein